MKFIFKNCVFIPTCLNFTHLHSTLHLMQSTYWDIFPLLKTVLNSLILMPFSASAFFFYFTSSTSAKRFPLRTFFIQGTQKSCSGWNLWIRRMGHGGHAIFGQKLLITQCDVGKCAHKSPIIKWANTLKESSNKIHWSWTQPLTTMLAGTLIQMGS